MYDPHLILFLRLFVQPESDDASHNKIFASRVAALNVLDRTPERLDIRCRRRAG